MTHTFTHAKCFTVGLVAFGWNGATPYVASRSQIQTALREAERNDTGHADLDGVTLPARHLQTLLATLGSDRP